MNQSELPDYEAAKEWLYGLKNRGSSYGIDRMRLLAEELGSPQSMYPIIHVAGTNGKGSTAAMLEAIFRAHGYKTGLSTSPHLVRQGERIQVNRRILQEGQVFEYICQLKIVAERIGARDPEMYPSFFEFMTAMAFTHFASEEVDVAIVEVGLGGRLDATNVLDPELCVITSIGKDHCEILGDTLAKIAIEKAGILKPGKPVVVGLLPEEAEAEIARIAEERGCELIRLKDRYGESVEGFPITSLKGDYQRINAGIASVVVDRLKERFKLDPVRAKEALLKVKWPGRWEELQLEHRTIVFDVSHNAEGARWLDRSLGKLSREAGAPDVVMGVMGEYRARALVPVVARWARSITFVIPEQSRSCSFEELERCVPANFNGAVERSTVDTIFPAKGKCALDLENSPPLVVTGSIYLIGEVCERFFENANVGQSMLQDF